MHFESTVKVLTLLIVQFTSLFVTWLYCKSCLKMPFIPMGTLLKFLRFFYYVFKMKFKNNVCFNLTTKTSKYHLEVSQFSDQCFCGFLLILLSKKSKHIFFRKFFHVTFKNLYFEFGVEI